MILRFLNWQGAAGIAACLALSLLLVGQKVQTAHWKKQSANFEQLYRQELAAFTATTANYRAAAEQARAADQAHLARVASEQTAINERTSNDFEARLADARDAAQRLRDEPQADAHSGARGGSPVPRVSTAPGGVAQTAGQDRLPPSDSLTATEQAIQLDELIKWVRAQSKVDNNPAGRASLPGD